MSQIMMVHQCKKRLCWTIAKRSKEFWGILYKNLTQPNSLSKQLSSIDFYLISRSITSNNKKTSPKSWNTLLNKFSSLARNCNLPHSQLTRPLLILHNISYDRKNLIYLKQIYIFQPNQITSVWYLYYFWKDLLLIYEQPQILQNLKP